MSPLHELLEQAKQNKKNKMYVISTDYVIRKLKEHIKMNGRQTS